MSDQICFVEAEQSLLMGYGLQKHEFELFSQLVDGNFFDIASSRKFEEIFGKFLNRISDSVNVEDLLHMSAQNWLKENNTDFSQLQLLSFGAAALLAFVQDNWTGPCINSRVPWLAAKFSSLEEFNQEVIKCLVLDGESVCSVSRSPELLLLARAALLTHLPNIQTGSWWKLRCLVIHQQILEEKSPQLHQELTALAQELAKLKDVLADINLQVLLSLELAHMHLIYHEVLPSTAFLSSAMKIAGIQISLTGALGKRTRFQQKNVAQLATQVTLESRAPLKWKNEPVDNLPKDLSLNDDVRLNSIEFVDSDQGNTGNLNPIQQACVLGTFILTMRSQPKDKLADEELLAYLTCLLSQPQVWSFQMTSLLFRCKIESNNSRTVERSMTQAQALVDALDSKSPSVWQRLSLIFCSYLCPRWRLEAESAALLVSLGCINSALDVYLRIEAWEEVIACYNHLQLRHKAAEIIRKELEVKESVKLWCLLGDATDDVECYEKAWTLSKERSGRAQRHWGQYYFSHHQYSEAIPHFKKSVELNSLQTDVWFKLGFAALDQEDWSTSATAYRRFCTLDPENYEAWNNLAKAYVKLGQKNRAWKALQEALKWDYENWRVWDNYMVVSVDCAAFDEVIRAYHRLLDLKDKHVDVEVLEVLAKAIVQNLPDCEGQKSKAHLSKALSLFGRITSKAISEWKIWQLYSLLVAAEEPCSFESEIRAIQFSNKAVRLKISSDSWAASVDECRTVLSLSKDLAQVSLDHISRNRKNDQSLSVLTSTKLCLKSVLAKIKQEQWNHYTNSVIEDISPAYTEIESMLDEVLQAAQQQ